MVSRAASRFEIPLLTNTVYFLYPETANVRLEDMNALFGDATTAMPTPSTQAERGSLMGVGSPASMDIRRGSPHPGAFSANDAIPGLDIDPPDIEVGPDGKAVARGRSQNGGEGLGGWIGRMVSRTRNRERSDSNRGQYGRIHEVDD